MSPLPAGSIVVRCSGCGRQTAITLNQWRRASGKRVRCPDCGRGSTVPEYRPPPAAVLSVPDSAIPADAKSLSATETDVALAGLVLELDEAPEDLDPRLHDWHAKSRHGNNELIQRGVLLLFVLACMAVPTWFAFSLSSMTPHGMRETLFITLLQALTNRVSWYLFLLAPFALWVLYDATLRRMPAALPWFIGMIALPVAAFPLYLARRDLVPGEVREGGTGWNSAKGFALFWTAGFSVGAIQLAGLYALLSWARPEIAKVDLPATELPLQEWANSVVALGNSVFSVGMAIVLLLLWIVPLVAAAVLGFLLKTSVVERGPVIPPTRTPTPKPQPISFATGIDFGEP